MKLSECKIGVVVSIHPGLADQKRDGTKITKIGHIVGLTLNVSDNPEVIPTVLWASSDRPIGVHHLNLMLYED